MTPSQKLLHLVNPVLHVNQLGDRYKAQTFDLSIATQVGTMSDGTQRRVFSEPGEYSIVFRDANTTAGEDLRTFSCEVTLPAGAAAVPSADANAVALDAQGKIARFPAGCNYVGGGCAGKPCCHSASNGGPCYCSTCCITRTGIAGSCARAPNKNGRGRGTGS